MKGKWLVHGTTEDMAVLGWSNFEIDLQSWICLENDHTIHGLGTFAPSLSILGNAFLEGIPACCAPPSF